MNTRILLLAVVVSGLASCSTAYRTGQTPDDVYFSPDRGQDEYVVVNQNRASGERYNDRYDDRGGYYSPDDNYLRMMVRNRARWSAFDDYYWMDSRMMYPSYGGYYNPFAFGGGYYSPWSPWSSHVFFNNYWSWNSFYNPYGYHYVVVNPKTNPNAYTKLRSFNTRSYTNSSYTNGSAMRKPGYYRETPGYNNNRNRNSNNPQLGNSLKKVFSGNDRQGNTYDRNESRPVRTYNPSPSYTPSRSSGSSNSSNNSGGNSGGGGSRPSRGGR